jgi:hypothetical protein
MHEFAYAKKNYCLTKNHIIVLQEKKAETNILHWMMSHELVVLLRSWHFNWCVFGKKTAHYQMKKLVMVGEPMAKSSASRGHHDGEVVGRGCRIYRE